jgi:hypothetical protein
MLYGLGRFQPLNPNDPWLWRSALVGYALAFAVSLVAQRKLFPWGRSAPVMKWLGILVVPVPWAMLGICAFLFGNALLDRSQPQQLVRLIDESQTQNEYSLMSDRKVVTGERLQVRRGTPRLAQGTRVVLAVQKGFFGSAWITGYEVQGAR